MADGVTYAGALAACVALALVARGVVLRRRRDIAARLRAFPRVVDAIRARYGEPRTLCADPARDYRLAAWTLPNDAGHLFLTNTRALVLEATEFVIGGRSRWRRWTIAGRPDRRTPAALLPDALDDAERWLAHLAACAEVDDELHAWLAQVRWLDLSGWSSAGWRCARRPTPDACARSDRWCPQPSIAGRTVVSAPGAAIRVEVVHLSPEMRARLTLDDAAAERFRAMRLPPTKGPTT